MQERGREDYLASALQQVLLEAQDLVGGGSSAEVTPSQPRRAAPSSVPGSATHWTVNGRTPTAATRATPAATTPAAPAAGAAVPAAAAAAAAAPTTAAAAAAAGRAVTPGAFSDSGSNHSQGSRLEIGSLPATPGADSSADAAAQRFLQQEASKAQDFELRLAQHTANLRRIVQRHGRE